MDQHIKTEYYKGYRIDIYYDTESMDPREFDSIFNMICFHKKYTIGDKHNYTVKSLHEYLEDKKENLIVSPVYLYDHSGLVISTTPFSCPWDSGQIGYIFCDYKEAVDEFGLSPDSKESNIEVIIKQMNEKIIYYNKYLSGDFYCYHIMDKNGSTVDSQCNIDDIEGAILMAKTAIDEEIVISNHQELYKCNEDCNTCDKDNTNIRKQIYLMMSYIDKEYPEIPLLSIINRFCVGFSVCPKCHCDDFTHIEGCEFSNL
jgi:hypothetical protein